MRESDVEPSKVSASRSISLKAKREVRVTSSTQLLRLSQMDNPSLLIEAMDGSVTIDDGSSIVADRVNLNSRNRNVELMNTSVAAREIKARVYDSGGTLLLSNAILGNGTNPSELIRLYGEGAGGVRFVGDTTLRGDTVNIAGKTVSIAPGSRVRLSNPSGTTVFSNFFKFNDMKNGNFTGLVDSPEGRAPVTVNKAAFGKRPGY